MNKLSRWIPALAAPVVIVGAALAVPAIASAASPLPSKSPQQVLELIAKGETAAYSGTVQQSSDLGLPDLSALENAAGPAGASGNDLIDLLTASHTAKVYTDGANRQRLQVLDTLAERDVVRNGTTTWLYDSSQKQATKLTTTGKSVNTKTRAPETTPAQLASQLVTELQPSTDFAVSTQDKVAGRSVYRLTLTPKTAGTLVKDATVAVDASTGVPLEVSVYANGQTKPAETIAFSSIRYGTPAASVFEFTPPKGTTVTTPGQTPRTGHGTAHPKAEAGARPTVVGSGWSSIAELPAGSVDLSKLVSGGSSSSSGSSKSGANVEALTGLLQSVPGGRGLQTSLVSVLFTTDGRVLAGAVPLTALENAAQ
jgi:outer membrane lipoprotein-sorting protein